MRHCGESGAAADEDANENTSRIFHPRHLQMGCGIFGSLEPVERGDGKAAVCAWRGLLPGVRREGESAPGLSDPVLFALGGLKYLTSHNGKLTLVP